MKTKKEAYINSVDERKFMALSLLILDVVLALIRMEAWVRIKKHIYWYLKWNHYFKKKATSIPACGFMYVMEIVGFEPMTS